MLIYMDMTYTYKPWAKSALPVGVDILIHDYIPSISTAFWLSQVFDKQYAGFQERERVLTS